MIPKKLFVLDGGQGTEMENRVIEVALTVWPSVPFMGEFLWIKKFFKERKIVEEMYKVISRGSSMLMAVTIRPVSRLSWKTPISNSREYNLFLDRIIKSTRSCIGEEGATQLDPWAVYNSNEHTGDYDDTTMEKIGEYIKGLETKASSNFLLLGINCVSFNDSSEILKLLHNALPDIP
ncbi:BDC_1c_G0031390.mRNA.1.CDS.1 [Saccharomyces cerevisiae]|nr:AIG_G0006460.mRNA.1.CDS.1 [Saccharomyces cerevisiae]CAI4563359.1 BDF_1d_G0031350.mRNA.1.CDS.1 [Saccharomyces cerevisiae]CAI4568986.1 BDC_1c_G0031390.mRNA.1.CDS.1 [Saccharomyces cerevisiae]CAI6526831.1 AIG_G0006460.mRNA.1.CDS.1 [Saccharomyces cerevisiae]CAI6640779.1 AAB_G0016610.mRNA.1.CDS.1 [Saccharomyces cerevisiae]